MLAVRPHCLLTPLCGCVHTQSGALLYRRALNCSTTSCFCLHRLNRRCTWRTGPRRRRFAWLPGIQYRRAIRSTPSCSVFNFRYPPGSLATAAILNASCVGCSVPNPNPITQPRFHSIPPHHRHCWSMLYITTMNGVVNVVNMFISHFYLSYSDSPVSIVIVTCVWVVYCFMFVFCCLCLLTKPLN